jgi:hypothetical protein
MSLVSCLKFGDNSKYLRLCLGGETMYLAVSAKLWILLCLRLWSEFRGQVLITKHVARGGEFTAKHFTAKHMDARPVRGWRAEEGRIGIRG